MDNMYIIFLSHTKYCYWLPGCKNLCCRSMNKKFGKYKSPKGFEFHWPSLKMCYDFAIFKHSGVHKEAHHSQKFRNRPSL